MTEPDRLINKYATRSASDPAMGPAEANMVKAKTLTNIIPILVSTILANATGVLRSKIMYSTNIISSNNTCFFSDLTGILDNSLYDKGKYLN